MKKGFSFIIGGQKYDTTVKEKEPNIAEVVVNGTSFIVEFKKNESKKVKAARPVAPTTTTVAAAPAQPAGAATGVYPVLRPQYGALHHLPFLRKPYICLLQRVCNAGYVLAYGKCVYIYKGKRTEISLPFFKK